MLRKTANLESRNPRTPTVRMKKIVPSQENTFPIYFDGEWYLLVNPDVAEAGIDPLVHFMNFGAHEKRNPNPDFDTETYLRLNSDIASFPLGPFLHYVFYGYHEGRKFQAP